MSTQSGPKPARGKTTPTSNAGSYAPYAHGVADVDLDAENATEAQSEPFPVHPAHLNTEAADCPDCSRATLGVAIDCAYDNMHDAGEDVDDHELAERWGKAYVENGDVSPYWCVRHDPANADYWAARTTTEHPVGEPAEDPVEDTAGDPAFISREEAIAQVHGATGVSLDGDPAAESTQRAWRTAREKAKRLDAERGDTLASDIVHQAAEALDLPRHAAQPPAGWGSFDADDRWPGAYEAYARREGDLQMRITPGDAEAYTAPGFHWSLDHTGASNGPSMSGTAATLAEAARQAEEAGRYITSGAYEYDNLTEWEDDER